MITGKDAKKIGKVLKHRKNGLVIYFDTKDIDHYSSLESVFVEYGRELIPFFITSFSIRSSNTAEIGFSDLTLDQAMLLIDSSVWIYSDEFIEADLKKTKRNEMIGYRVSDKVKGEIGFVSAFIDRSMQPMIEVQSKDKKILIPMAEQIVCHIDNKKKSIIIDSPEGLLDI